MKLNTKHIIGIGLLAAGLTIGTAYKFSDKIGYIKHTVCKDLSDSLGRKEVLCDQETNDIIKLMSGKISQQSFDSLLARYGYKNTSINIEKLIKPDEALYSTILELQTKYANPKISFSGFLDNLNIETLKNEPERPRYNIFNNTIHLHQLDARILQFKNINQDDKFWAERMMGMKSYVQQTWKNYLLNNWITELSHAFQLQEQGVVKMGVDGLIDYIGTGFDYSKIYSMPGTLEYEAHSSRQLNMIKEFIEIYTRRCDTTNPNHVFMLAKLHRGFFSTYQNGHFVPYINEQQSAYYLNMLDDMGHSFSSYLMGRYYQDIYDKEYNYSLDKADISKDTLLVEVHGDTMTRVALFEKFIFYYQKSYKQGNLDAGCDILSLIDVHRPGSYDDLVIYIGNDMLKRHIGELDELSLIKIYRILGTAYFHKGNKKKGEKYLKMAATLFSQSQSKSKHKLL